MTKIYIRLDFLAGPIWRNFLIITDEKRLFTGIDKVDYDKELIDLNEKAQDFFSSYYDFDIDGFFDFQKEKDTKNELLDLIYKIKNRLNELNDGSFEVIDEESERIKAL